MGAEIGPWPHHYWELGGVFGNLISHNVLQGPSTQQDPACPTDYTALATAMEAYKLGVQPTTKLVRPLEPRLPMCGINIYFQNCMGLYPNLDLLMAKIASE